MAFDQASLFLYPPRWQSHSVATDAKHCSGGPVQVVSDVRAEDCNEGTVSLAALGRWFEAKGFESVQRSATYAEFWSDSVESYDGPRPEIDVSAGVLDGEVTGIYCRFLLTRATPGRLQHWEAFARDLCDEFDLRIRNTDTAYVGPDEFLATIRGMDSWRCFAKSFGWSDW